METDPLPALRDHLGEDLYALPHRGDVPVRAVRRRFECGSDGRRLALRS
jgi:hypothetical protein